MDLINLHDVPESEDKYVRFLRQICEKFGFDDAAYAGINPAAGTMHTFVTYSDDWKGHYIEHNFQLIDPTLHTAIRSVAPVDWSRLRRDANYARVFKDAGDFGIGMQSGMTIPVRGTSRGVILANSGMTSRPAREHDELARGRQDDGGTSALVSRADREQTAAHETR
jgi:hypothetical protein